MLIAVFCLLIPITIDSVKECKCLTKDLTNGKIKRINKIKIIIFFIVVLLYFLYDYIRMFLKNERVFYGK